jgi:peptide/nickel transport system substrate-binding protein
MKRRKLLTASALMAGVLALTACVGSDGGSTGGGSGEPVIDGTLNYAIKDDPGNLMRHLNTSINVSYVYPWAYESPVYFDENGQPQGWLAESWKETPKSLEFTIREGVMCEDGTELTAETVANNYRWILDPINGSSFAGLVVPPDAAVEHDNDTRTVTLTTGTPNSFLLASIGIHPIYCQGALDDPDSVAAATNGTGLYGLTEAVQGDHYTFERKDDYSWGPKGGVNGSTPGVPKNVVVQVIENPSTRANMLLSGELNMAQISGPDEDRIAAQLEPLISDNLITGGFTFSQAEGQPTADEDMRVALVKALDLDSLMRVMTSDKGERAPRMAVLAPQMCVYNAAGENLPTTDVTDAAAMLDELGWTEGPDGVREKDGEPLELTFVYNTRYPEIPSVVELMAEQWEAVGVRTVLEGSSYAAYAERIVQKNASQGFDVLWQSANYSVPNVLAAFIAGPTPPTGNNYSAIVNPEFDALVAESAKFTGTEACGAWEQAEAELYASADYVPFAMHPEVTYAQGVEAAFGNNRWVLGPSFTLVQD